MIINIKMPFGKLRNRIIKYFYRPTIVYSKTHEPALLVKAWSTAGGDGYARVKFSNKAVKQGFVGITDIPKAMVIKAVKGTSPFLRDWHSFKKYIKAL
jgi:hypothetical protein